MVTIRAPSLLYSDCKPKPLKLLALTFATTSSPGNRANDAGSISRDRLTEQAKSSMTDYCVPSQAEIASKSPSLRLKTIS